MSAGPVALTDWRDGLDAVDDLGLVPAGLKVLELAERPLLEHGIATPADRSASAHDLRGDRLAAVRIEREEDLYAPVKAFLEAQGYEVKAEVQGCDLVARRPGETPLIVEMKTGFTLPLVLQGIDRLALSDHVYLAVPVAARPARTSLWRRERRGILRLCRRLGLGLLAVHEAAATTLPLVEPLLDPLPYRPRPDRRRQGLLLREFAHRVGDPNTGGTTRRPIVTAYRQAALRCAAHLERHGPTKVAQVARATSVAQAGRILQRDAYGWFQRIERGTYVLSPRGAAALDTYAHVLPSLADTEGAVIVEEHPAEPARGRAAGQQDRST